MTQRDQIEIIGPGGEIKFLDLDPAKGFTNVGSHPDNDIVIPSPEVAPFHAVIDHRGKPCQIIVFGRGGRTFVSGQPVEPNSSHVLNNWDTIQLDGHSLILMEGLAGGFAPVGPVVATPASAFLPASRTTPPLASAPPLGVAPVSTAGAAPVPAPLLPPVPGDIVAPGTVANAPIPDHTDDFIVAEVSVREFTLDVDQAANFDVTLINGGDIVATFMVTLAGLDPDWVVAPGSVNLFEGERATVPVTITPPRRPTSRAGTHYFSVSVHSDQYPSHVSRTGCTLVVNPYYDHAVGELSPRQQGLGWTKRTGSVTYPITNRGNSQAAFRLDSADDERALQFEFKLAPSAASLAKQAELHLAPEETRTVAVNFTLLQRKFFAFGNHYHSFTVTTTPLHGQQQPRALLAQAESWPLVGPIHIVILLLLLTLLIAWAFRPSISSFTADKPQVMSDEIMRGGKVKLTWDSSWFADVKIDQEVGAQPRGSGSADVAPVDTTTYRLTATTPLLSQIFAAWFTGTQEQTIEVNPVDPIIRLKLDKDQVITGQSATLSWEVLNADEVTLGTNGALETIPKEQYVSTRSISPQAQVVFVLQAKNHYNTVSSTKTLNAVAPTATPFPKPIIQRFDASPGTIIAGQDVTLEWSVTNAEKVRLDPGAQEFPPVGKIVIRPDQNTSYILTAFNGPEETRSIRDVVVNPAPTPTPVPGSPVIDFFTGTPLEVFLGSPEATNIQLAWAVSGDATSIELSGDSIGKIAGLDRQGTLVAAAGDQDTQFVLTAYNGPITASQTVTVKVSVPVPVISSLDPSSWNKIGTALTLTVAGNNFVNGATVRWNGSDRSTTFINSGQLLVSVTVTDVAKAGTAQITVFNPAEAGGGESSPATFAINNPVPVLSAVNPDTALVGDADTTLVITGSSFIADSKVRWNSVEVPTTYNNPGQLTAVMPADKFAVAAIASVSVFNPAPVGGSSGGKQFIVQNPTPVVLSVSPPTFRNVGDDAFVLTVNGSGFVGGTNGTQVTWSASVRPTVFVNTTQLLANIPACDLANAAVGPNAIPIGAISPSINDVGGGPSNTVPFEVRPEPVNVTLTASPFTAVSGQPVSFSVNVAPVNSSIGGALGGCPNPPTYIPTGTIDFMDGSTAIGQAVLPGSSPANVTLTPAKQFAAGDYSITATYNGDILFGAKTSTVLTYHVDKANTTVSSITASNSTPSLGTPVTLTASVNPVSPGASIPFPPSGGTVQFFNNGAPLGSPVAVSGNGLVGQASYTTGNLELLGGQHNITASYDGTGDSNFNSTTTSVTLVVTVTEATPIIAVSPNTPSYGQSSTFTATVTGPACVPPPACVPAPAGGTVLFAEGASQLGSQPLSNGTATLTVPAFTFAAGSHSITVTYDGSADPNYLSGSTTVSHTVSQAPTTVSVTSGGTTYGQAAQLTATVSGGAAGTPTSGTVTFQIDGSSVATVSIQNGTATYTTGTTQMRGGNHSIIATYNGNSNFSISPPSPVWIHTVQRVTPTITITCLTNGCGTVDTNGANGNWKVVVSGSPTTPTGYAHFFYSSSYTGSGKDFCANTQVHKVEAYVFLDGSGTAFFSHPIWEGEGGFAVYAVYNDTGYDPNFNSVTSSTITGNEDTCK